MALTDQALTTLQVAQDELGIDASADLSVFSRIERYINAVSAAIASYCNREFYYEADIVENLPGYGDVRLVVSRPPLLSISSIVINSGTVDSTEYKIESVDAGFIYRESGWIWTAVNVGGITFDPLPGTEDPLYVTTYTGGYVTPAQEDAGVGTRTLPYDLEDACLKLLSGRYAQQGENPNIKSEKLLSYAVTYGNVGTDQPFPADIMTVLDRYKVAAVA